jgi:hypothetical protein
VDAARSSATTSPKAVRSNGLQSKPGIPQEISPKYANESAARARMHTCLGQYRINTQTDGNKGLRWIARGRGHYRVQQCAETPMLGAQGLREPGPTPHASAAGLTFVDCFSRRQPNPRDVVRCAGRHQIACRHCDQSQRKPKHRAQPPPQQRVRGQDQRQAHDQCAGDLRRTHCRPWALDRPGDRPRGTGLISVKGRWRSPADLVSAR